jgi:RNA polymerase sigma-70 factor (ECF subfamily)
LCRNRGLAEDVLHDVFVAFFKRAGSLVLTGSMRGYLAVSVANQIRKVVTSKQYATIKGYDVDRIDCSRPSPDEQLMHQEAYQQLEEALAELPLEQREVICLHLQGQMTFKEIASALALSVNTIQSRYRYGLEKLRMLMAMEHQDES